MHTDIQNSPTGGSQAAQDVAPDNSLAATAPGQLRVIKRNGKVVPYTDDKIAIAVRKGNDELRERLNKALAEIIADGTYKQINDKYFPFNIY